MSTDRRHPVIPFDASLIQDYLLGRGVSSVALFPSGKSNSNYKLTLSTGEICVLRLYNQNEDAAQGTTITNLVTDLLPVPHALHHGDGWSVFTYLEGELLATVPEHTEAAAEALAKLSTITFPSPGLSMPMAPCHPSPLQRRGS
jgi:Ser/Thr protein kinase RdoA (MazF antagonist)